MWVKESITDFFPVPPAHYRVTRCDTALKHLLGIIGDLLDVSPALEEHIIPEYLIQQNPRELFICLLLIIYIVELFILLVYLGVDLNYGSSTFLADLTIGYQQLRSCRTIGHHRRWACGSSICSSTTTTTTRPQWASTTTSSRRSQWSLQATRIASGQRCHSICDLQLVVHQRGLQVILLQASPTKPLLSTRATGSSKE